MKAQCLLGINRKLEMKSLDSILEFRTIAKHTWIQGTSYSQEQDILFDKTEGYKRRNPVG